MEQKGGLVSWPRGREIETDAQPGREQSYDDQSSEDGDRSGNTMAKLLAEEKVD